MVKNKDRIKPPPITPRFLDKQNSIGRIRRLTDVSITGLLLAITFPLLLIVALAIKLEGPGSVLERRPCIGRGGRRFEMLTFRTTIHNPEHAARAWAQQMTQLGEFLRYTRIDALPQLINVLRGEMTLIAGDRFSPTFLD